MNDTTGEKTAFRVFYTIIAFTGLLLAALFFCVPAHGAHWPLNAASVSVGTTLVVNGTMEADANWNGNGSPTTHEQSAEQVHGGTYSRKFTVDAEYEGTRSDDYTTTTNIVYTITLWVYPDDTTGVKVYIRKGDDSGALYNTDWTGLTQDAWNKIEFDVTETAGGAGANILVESRAGETSGTWYVDDVSIKPRTTTDISPSALTAALYGADLRNHGADFDGTDDIVTVADNADLSITGDLSIFCSVKPDDGIPTSAEYVVTKYLSTGNQRSFTLLINNSGQIAIVGSTNGSTTFTHRSTSVVFSDGAATSFTDIGFTYDASGQNIDIYVDGLEVASSTVSGTIPTSLYDSTADFAIGALHGTDSPYAGLIADVYVYDSYLTAANMLSAYQGNPPDGAVAHWPLDYSPRDHTGNGNDGTNSGATFIGECLYLDGTDDYALVPDSDFLSFGNGSTDSAFSISAWVYMDTAAQFVIASKGIYNSSGEWAFQTDSGGDIKLNIFDESVASCFIGRKYDTALSAGQWIHLVGTYDGSGASSGIDIWVNGSEVDDADVESNAGSYVAMENLAADTYMGRNNTLYGNGYIAQLQTFPKELSTSEIDALYQAGSKGMVVESGRPQERGYWPLTLESQRVGDELIYAKHSDSDNNTFTTDTGNWSDGGTWDIDATVVNKAYGEGDGTNNYLDYDLDVVDGRNYISRFTTSNNSLNATYLQFAGDAMGTATYYQDINGSDLTSNGIHHIYWVGDLTGTDNIRLRIKSNAVSGSVEADDVYTCPLLSADLSAYGNHAQAFISDYSGSVSSDGTDFDGDVDYYKVTDHTAIQNIFDGGGWVEVIIEPDSCGLVAGRIFEKGSTQCYVANEIGGEMELWVVKNRVTTNGVWKTSNLEIAINTKQHVLISYDSSSTSNDPVICIDGTSVPLTEFSTPDGNYTTDVGSDLYIGDRSAGGRTFDGHIKNLRMGKGMIDALQAKKMYKDSKGDM